MRDCFGERSVVNHELSLYEVGIMEATMERKGKEMRSYSLDKISKKDRRSLRAELARRQDCVGWSVGTEQTVTPFLCHQT